MESQAATSNALQGIQNKKNYTRRIYAEDPDWNILSVKKLTDICLKVVVQNFERIPFSLLITDSFL